MVEKYAHWLQKHRLMIYIFSAVLACLTTLGLINFSFKVDYRTFFASDVLGYSEFLEMEEDFPASDDLAFVLAPGSGDVFSREVIDSLLWLKERLLKISFVERVETLTDYPFQTNTDGELYIGYVTDVPSPPYTLAFFREQALKDPMVAGTLVSHSGKSVAILVNYKLEGNNDLVVFPAAMEEVNQVKAEFSARYPESRLAIAGVLTYNHGIIDTAMTDLMILLPACSVIIYLILYFFLRSGRGAFFTMLIIGLTVGSTLGTWCWLGLPLNSASMSAPIAILALAVADCVHLSDSYLLVARDDPNSSRLSRVTHSLLLNSKAIFLTSLTSVLGFLTMNFCESPPYRDIGNLVAIGIAFAWLYSMTLFPALIGQFGLRHSKAQHHLNLTLHRVAGFICKHYKKILLLYGAVILLALSCMRLNTLDDNVVEWFDADVELRRDAEFIDQNHTGMYQLYYVIDTQIPDGILDPELLAEVDRFASWLRKQTEVVQARSLVDVFVNSYSAMSSREQRLPGSKGITKQILSTVEMLADDSSQLNSLVNRNRSALRIHVSLHTMTASEFIAFEQRVQDWLSVNRDRIGPDTHGISPTMMFAKLSQQIVPTMLVTTAIMILLISALLVLIFRSATLGMISLVPNLIPIGMAFGFWGLFSGHLGIALSIVSGASLGIVVDDSIHLLLKYQRARTQLMMSPPLAVTYAITRVGDALTITTLTLVAGFITLGFSSLQPNAELGTMLGVIIGLALVTDLLFVPALLLWIEERHPILGYERKSPS